MTGAQVGVLGPLLVELDGAAAPAGGPLQRMVLGMLAARHGQVVSADALAEAVWGERAVERDRGTLQVYVSNLRKVLGSPDAIVGRPPGYLLDPALVAVDATLFAQDVAAGREAAAGGDPAAGVRRLREGLGRWRGTFLADLELPPDLADVATALTDLRLTAREECLDAELVLGRHEAVVGELEAACRANPLRERLWGLLMVALYRCGRQGDALATFQRAREVLVEELGVDPGPVLRRLERSILDQSVSLDLVSDSAPALLWIEPSGQLRRVALDPGAPVTIGRVRPNTVVLEWDSAVSRAHARIECDPTGGWTLVDGPSLNGTWRNGAKVDSVVLADGDLLRCGDTSLFVRLARPLPTPAVAEGDRTLLRDPANPSP